MKKSFATAILMLLMVACHTVHTADSYADFVKATELQVNNDLYRGTYYCGSADGFDYYCIKRDLFADVYYKIPAGELPIKRSPVYPAPREQWQCISNLLK